MPMEAECKPYIRSRVGAALVLVALFCIAVSWFFWLETNTRMKLELESVHARFQTMQSEHLAAMEAANAALKARETINAEFEKRIQEIDVVIDTLDNVQLPDSVRQALAAGNKATKTDASTGTNAKYEYTPTH